MKIFRTISHVGVAARISGILFALFISVFAIDVFTEELGFWKTVAALFIHLLPSFFVLLIIFISWRFEWVGALIFIALGMAYIFTRQADPLAYLLIAGPLFLTGFLFLWSWFKNRHESGEYDVNG
jgi:hypothetical protein